MLTRKMLKGMSLTDEQIDTIIEAHTEVTDALKKERDRYKEDAEKLPEVQKELEKYSGGDSFEEKYKALKKEYDDYKSEQTAKEEKTAKEEAYRGMLREAGVSEKRLAAVLRVADLSGIKLEKDGTIKDKDSLIQSVKTEWSDFIEAKSTKGANTQTPPANNGAKMTRADIFKRDDKGRYVLSAQERQKAIAENPSAFQKGV